jgi:hypothetical protein
MADTVELNMAGHKLEVGAQLVDHIDQGIQASVFASGGVLVVGRARDKCRDH